MIQKLIMGIATCALLFSSENIWMEVNGSYISANKLIIKFDEKTAPLTDREAPLSLSNRPEITEALKEYHPVSLFPAFHRYKEFTQRQFQHGLHRFYGIAFEGKTNITEAAEILRDLPGVELVEYNYRVETAFVPNDNFYDTQWAHNNTGQVNSYNGGLVGTPDCDMDTDEAWDISQGSDEIIVAVLDTGVSEHDELGDRLLPGYNAYSQNYNTNDVFGHGTQCAGIIAAQGNNNIGVAGVSWETLILPVKVLSDGGYGDQFNLADGIEWATDNGADVISMSLRWTEYVSLAETMVTYAYDNGVVVFAATGNEDSSVIGYPSAYENCIAVGALSPCNERKSYSSCDGENYWGSNYGNGLDFLAPGVRIPTITNTGGYTPSFNGTSSACPAAAGVAALILATYPQLTPEQVRQIMQETSVNLYSNGWDSQSGYGRINAFNAVQRAVEMNCGLNNIPGDTNLDGQLNVLDIVIVSNIIVGILQDPDYCQEWAANINNDDIVNILDIILIINAILEM